MTAALAKTDEAIAFIDIAFGGSQRALAILQRINVPEFDGEELQEEGESR